MFIVFDINYKLLETFKGELFFQKRNSGLGIQFFYSKAETSYKRIKLLEPNYPYTWIFQVHSRISYLTYSLSYFYFVNLKRFALLPSCAIGLTRQYSNHYIKEFNGILVRDIETHGFSISPRYNLFTLKPSISANYELVRNWVDIYTEFWIALPVFSRINVNDDFNVTPYPIYFGMGLRLKLNPVIKAFINQRKLLHEQN